MYGVDVTDVQRRFSDEEMTTLGANGQRYIFQERRRLNRERHGGGGRGGGRGRDGNGGRGRGGGRGIGQVQTDENRANGGSETGEPTTGTATGTSGDRGSTNGRRFGAGAYGGGSTETEGRGVSMITCGPRRHVGKVEKGWQVETDKTQSMVTGRN